MRGSSHVIIGIQPYVFISIPNSKLQTPNSQTPNSNSQVRSSLANTSLSALLIRLLHIITTRSFISFSFLFVTNLLPHLVYSFTNPISQHFLSIHRSICLITLISFKKIQPFSFFFFRKKFWVFLKS